MEEEILKLLPTTRVGVLQWAIKNRHSRTMVNKTLDKMLWTGKLTSFLGVLHVTTTPALDPLQQIVETEKKT